ncbi:hypothetical protein D3C79_1029890 [compost metagenome]
MALVGGALSVGALSPPVAAGAVAAGVVVAAVVVAGSSDTAGPAMVRTFSHTSAPTVKTVTRTHWDRNR